MRLVLGQRDASSYRCDGHLSGGPTPTQQSRGPGLGHHTREREGLGAHAGHQSAERGVQLIHMVLRREERRRFCQGRASGCTGDELQRCTLTISAELSVGTAGRNAAGGAHDPIMRFTNRRSDATYRGPFATQPSREHSSSPGAAAAQSQAARAMQGNGVLCVSRLGQCRRFGGLSARRGAVWRRAGADCP